VKTAVERQLSCIGLDDVPANGASATVSYSPLNPGPVRNFAGGLAQPIWSPFPMMMQNTTTNPDPNHYKFTGKELDDETGLYNYGARYYSPSLGRYMTPDWSQKPTPVPYADLTNPQTLNLYTYSHNNPISFGDPDGHDPGDKFKSKTAAAADAVRYIRKQSNGYKWEYGTRIFKGGKTYSYNNPVTQQNPKGVDLPPLQKNDVGDVHTHNYGVGDDAHANSVEQPDRIGTVQDKEAVQKMQDDPKTSVDYQSYVGAPNGDLVQFTPNSNASDGLGDAKVVQHNVGT
jgi:RHS repeat-associated protein